MKKYALAPIMLAACLTFAACGMGDETAGPVKEEAETAATVEEEAPAQEGAGAPEGESESPAGEEVDAPAENATAALGDLVGVGDWDVKILNVNRDAGGIIQKANEFNEKAAGTYVLVDFEATYNGDERIADMSSDMTWSMTTSDSQVMDQSYVVTPADNESWPTEARTGGMIKGQTVFDVPADKIKGGILTVEVMDMESFDTVFADFAL